jgi:DNA invertase Pin-like site-specific DNA recombinase
MNYDPRPEEKASQSQDCRCPAGGTGQSAQEGRNRPGFPLNPGYVQGSVRTALQAAGTEEDWPAGNILSPMLIGYARVSTQDQTLALQQDALQKADCMKIFTDTASGAKAERKGLEQALTYVRKGDTLVVWRLDRLGRSLPHLIATMTDLEERGIGFKSLTENIDTITSGGKLIFHIFGALAEFERNLIRERTLAGLAAARARGRKGGRPKSLTPEQRRIAQALYDDPRNSIADICRTFKITRFTLYRNIDTKANRRKSPSEVKIAE